MKKMKCTSCGANLKVEENKEYAVCEHCGSKYKLNEDVNINFKLDDNMKEVVRQGLDNYNKTSKIIIAVFVVMLVGILTFFFFIGNNFNKKKINNESQMEKNKNEFQDQFNRDSFNYKFSIYMGNHSGFQIKYLLNDIILSNKTETRKISLVFNGESISEESRISEVKQGLVERDMYEVDVNYDDDGYIKEIEINQIVDK